MPPPSWTTREQWAWLFERKGACADARRRGRLSPWLTTVYHDFFIRWPECDIPFGPNAPKLTPEQEVELADAIETRQNQIYVWFKNHRSRTARDSRGVPAAITQSLMKGKGRAPQAREVFCRMFYDDEKKAVVERDLTAERKVVGRKLDRREVLRITRARVDTMFSEAGDEVRAQVEARVAEEKALRAVSLPTEGGSQMPQDYQKFHTCHMLTMTTSAIDAAPTLIEQLLEPIAQQTGWCYTVVAAGPSPENNGDIHSFA
ncbi:hypothetical protein C8Q80DRAFT_1096465 [Daedaleopsis nitida]|nr:hypothetical protein C8Q80DRAFT_1096465 [Daedaleopsis nitida]